MKILFFASTNCKKCKAILKAIKKSGLLSSSELIYIDAFDDNKQDFCDEHNVDELPHIKVYLGEKVVYEAISECNIAILKKYSSDEQKKLFNLSKNKQK